MPTDTSLDVARLDDWLTASVPGFRGPVTVSKIAGGQSNPTFRLTARSGRYILRRKPPGTLLKSAHAVDREFTVQSALAGTGVPVPQMFALCEEDGVLGTMFYVMEDMAGRTFDDPSLPELDQPGRTAIYGELARVLAAIHTVDVAAAGLTAFGRPGNYYGRQLMRWSEQYQASALEPLEGMARLTSWLTANLPADDAAPTLVHGDYRMDNLMFAKDGTRCIAVLDWELSTLGHPLADVAGLLMQWRLPQGAEGRGLKGVDRAALGIPSDEAFLASYAAHAGRPPIENIDFYIAFAFFRMAAILEGVKRRGLDGNASDPARAAAIGATVPHYVAGGLEAANV